MNKWQHLGKYYGYPECCTQSFNTIQVYERSLVQKSVHKNTGFIPCHECAMKIVNNETTLEGLIKNRICKTAFPNGGGNEQVDAYLASVKLTQHPGEDIRAAKAIYEHKHGFVTETNVSMWMRYANEVKNHLNVGTLQEAATKLDIKLDRIGK